MDERRRHERGMSVRRQVLGAAHVDQALRNRTDFNRDFQDLITRYALGGDLDAAGAAPGQAEAGRRRR